MNTFTGFPLASTSCVPTPATGVPNCGWLPASPTVPYCADTVAIGSNALRVALISISPFNRLSASSCNSGRFPNASFTASSNEGASMASGLCGRSVGIISTFTKFGASGLLLMAFFRICSFCNLAVWATMRFCRSVASSDSARVTSRGAIVPISNCFLLSL